MIRTFVPSDDNARLVPSSVDGRLASLRYDTVPTVPVGSYVAMVFRVTGYDRDCDGSAMARLEQVDRHGRTTGWEVTHLGLYPQCDVLVDDPHDLWEAAEANG